MTKQPPRRRPVPCEVCGEKVYQANDGAPNAARGGRVGAPPGLVWHFDCKYPASAIAEAELLGREAA